MRVVGAIALVVSFVVGAGLWLLPTSVSLLGSTADCSAPILRVLAHENTDNEISQAVVDQCHSQSWTRVIAGVVLGTILGVAGIVMLAAGRRDDNRVLASGYRIPAGWYPDPENQPGRMRFWNGSGWTGHYQPAPGGKRAL